MSQPASSRLALTQVSVTKRSAKSFNPSETCEWLTPEEAARHLRVKPRTVLKWAKEGRIPAHSLSGLKRVTWRFLKSELDAMLNVPSAAEDRRLQCAAE
jgi:excisionase family DNA binding protein